MQDTELFLSLAGIAGVFVGFGALISVRSGGASDATEVSYIRSVVSLAIWVVVAALAPVIVSRYAITGRELWLVCSPLALVLLIGWLIAINLTPEFRDAPAPPGARLSGHLGEVAANSLLFFPMVIALVLVVLGLFPDQEPALYLTAVGLGLSLSALTLLFLVFSQRYPSATPVPGDAARDG